MKTVGIVGGAGYTAGELLRILLQHPEVAVGEVLSQSQVGKPLYEVHHDLLGETAITFADCFTKPHDVVFLCGGHGASEAFLAAHPISPSTLLIDLSQDFRIQKDGNPFVYGLPELQKDAIREADRIANPGCFATAIQLALLPLAHAGLIEQAVHVQAITGSTGAGQRPTATSHFSWRNNNVSVYKAFSHQHLAEIKQSLRQLQPNFGQAVHFIPVRGNFSRGIMATAYTPTALSESELCKLYQDFYADAAFTFVAAANPHLKQVVNTNKAVVHVTKHEGQAFAICMIDNLLKGASGQAVQNMNLALGLSEKMGLGLKGIAF